MVQGLNLNNSSLRLDVTEARDAQNAQLFPIGGFRKRNGYDDLNSTAVGIDACTGLFMGRYSTSGGTNRFYLVSGTKLYSMPSTLNGTWTNITGGLTITAGNNNIWNFGILNDILVLGNGDIDTPIQINSSGVASALGGLPFTKFLFCVDVRGYMWYFQPTVGGVVQYDRGYFSDINTPVTVGTDNFIDVAKGNGADVRGAVEYKSYMYIFKRHGIYQVIFQPTRVNSSGTVFPWAEVPNPIVPGVGTQSHRSIVKFTTPTTHQIPGQEFVFFVDQFGTPRVFDGTTTISFQSKIGSSRDTTILSLKDMDMTRNAYAFSLNDPVTNNIYCFLSRLNSRQDTCWVLDYNTGFAFTRYKYNLAFNVGAIFEKPTGVFKPFVGDYAGKVYELDTTANDNGQPFDFYYATGDSFLQSPALVSKWFFMDVRGTNGDNDQSLDVDYYFDGSDTPSLHDSLTLANSQTEWGDGPPPMIWGQSQWAKQTLVARTSEINNTAKTCRVKFSNNDLNETVIVESFSLAGQTLGTEQN